MLTSLKELFFLPLVVSIDVSQLFRFSVVPCIPCVRKGSFALFFVSSYTVLVFDIMLGVVLIKVLFSPFFSLLCFVYVKFFVIVYRIDFLIEPYRFVNFHKFSMASLPAHTIIWFSFGCKIEAVSCCCFKENRYDFLDLISICLVFLMSE